jgi:hypothetical protein
MREVGINGLAICNAVQIQYYYCNVQSDKQTVLYCIEVGFAVPNTVFVTATTVTSI